MPDPIKDLYNSVKSNGLFVDENDFRTQLKKSPKDVYSTVSDLFVDYNDFENMLGFKKKDGSTQGSVSVVQGQQPIQAPQPDQIQQPNQVQQPSQSQLPSVSNIPTDPISELLKKRKKLVDEQNAFVPPAATYPGMPEPVKRDFTKEIAGVDEQIKAKGIDPNEVVSDFGEYDININDSDLVSLYNQKKNNPTLTEGKIASYKFQIATKNAIRNDKELSEDQKQKRLSDFETSIGNGDYPYYDLNLAIQKAKNELEQIYNSTAGNGEARRIAIENHRKVILPVLAQVALRDSNYVSQSKNLALDFGILADQIYASDKAQQEQDVSNADLKGNIPAQRGKEINLYDVESRGLSILSKAIQREFEKQGKPITDLKNWESQYGDRLNELISKIESVGPQDKEQVKQYYTEKDQLDKLVNSQQMLDLKDQELSIQSSLKNYEDEKNPKEKQRLYDLYVGEVDKYKLMYEQAPIKDIEEKTKSLNNIVGTLNSKNLPEAELEEYKNMVSVFDDLSAKAIPLQSKIGGWVNFIRDKQNSLYTRYPQVLDRDIAQAEQEYNGEKVGKFGKLVGSFKRLDKDIANIIPILYDNLFASPEKKLENDYERLGLRDYDDVGSAYQKESERLFEAPLLTVISPEVKKRLDDVKNNNALSDIDKKRKTRDILKSGFESGGIYKATNPKAGDLNLSVNSVLNAFVTVGPQLVTGVGLTALTGGGVGTLFLTTAMQGFSSYYDEAVSKGTSNPVQYATALTLVDATTEILGTSDLKFIQKFMSGKKGFAANFFKDLSEAEFKKLLSGSKRAFVNIAKTSGKTGLINIVESLEEYGAAVGGNIVKSKMFNEYTPTTQGAREALITTSVGMMPLSLLSIPVSVNQTNIGSKMGLYSAAADLKSTVSALEDQFKRGEITSEQYGDRVKAITEYAGIIKNMPKTYDDGTIMRDEDRVEYAFNQFIATRKKDQTLSPNQEAKINETISNVQLENDKILANEPKPAVQQQTVIEDPKVVITGTRNGLETFDSNNYNPNEDPKIQDVRGREGQFDEGGVLIDTDERGNQVINIKTDAIDSFGRRGFLQASVVVPAGTDLNSESVKELVNSEIEKLKSKYNGTLDLGKVQQEDLSGFKNAIVDGIKTYNKNIQNATQESKQQEGLPESGVVQSTRIETGQPQEGQGEGVQGQGQITQTDVSNRPIGSEGAVVVNEIPTLQKETEDKIKSKNLFIGVGEFANTLGGSGQESVPVNHTENNGIELVQYANPTTGVIDVVVTGTSENDYVGFYRLYENGNPTNKWSSKLENKSGNKQNFKTMISGVQSVLPTNHEYTEKTSISTDGLRVWSQQLNKGYEIQRDSNGNIVTNQVAINGDAKVNELGIPVTAGSFDNISVTSPEQFESVKNALLPYLEKLGLNESNIRSMNGTVMIDLPVLKSTKPTSTSSVSQGQVSGQDLSNIEDILSKNNWSTITATQESVGNADNPANVEANNKLKQELIDEFGENNVIENDGVYLDVPQGKSFIVIGISRSRAMEIGSKYGQQSVLTNDGNVFSDGSGYNPSSGKIIFGDEAKKQSGYSILPNGTAFSLQVEWEKKIPLPPETKVTPTETKTSPITERINTILDKVTQSLKPLKLKFTIVDSSVNPADADKVQNNQGIFISNKGEIVIDKAKLRNAIEAGVVVWHESSHPVMNIIRNSDNPLYKKMVAGMSKSGSQNRDIQRAINWAAENYSAEKLSERYGREVSEEEAASIQNDEAIVEILGRIAEGIIDIKNLNPGFKQTVIDFINKIAKALGISPLLSDTSIKTFKEKASEIVDALATGRDISEVVGAENVMNYGAPIGVPVQPTVADKYGPKIKHNGRTYKLSFVKPSDVINIEKLVKEISDNNQKVWFWVADQLGRGMYYDNVIEGEHYLDAGPSFALDPKNRNKKVIWATGKGEKWVNDMIAKSDYIFIISGSPQKSKLFNKRVAEITFNRIKKAVGEESSWDKFKSEVLGVSKIGEINKILNKYNSFEELLANPDRKKLLIQFDAQKEKKGTPLKSLLEKYGAFVNYNDLRDGFFKENNFNMNDVMIVLKPTGYGGKSEHSTYENDIIGEVVGVPDRKVNAYDLMPDDFKAKYAPNMSRMEQSQAVAPYGAGVRNVQPSVGKREASELQKNEAAKTQGFFSDVVKGLSDKYKPIKEWVPVLSFDKAQEGFKKVFDKYMGNFDLHIATSIPTFRETQVKVGNAIVDMYKSGLVYDLGGSEGGFVKAITESSDGKIKTINLDPNPDMKAVHEATPVKGSEFVQEAFLSGFEENGVTYETHQPKAKADVVHESMMFQFITPEREAFVREVADKYLKDGGLFITEQKFSQNKEEYDRNEKKKAKYKDEYYTKEQQAMKSDDVLVGMKENQANIDTYKNILKDKFKYVEQYWDSGNFKGFVASNSKSKVDEFMDKVGSTESEFTTTPLKNNEQASVGKRSDFDLGRGKEKTRGLSRTFETLPTSTALKIEDEAVKYFERTNKQTKDAVLEFMDGKSNSDLADFVVSNPDIDDVSLVWMAAEVAKNLTKEIEQAKGNDALVKELSDKQARIYNQFAKKATSLGQAVQAFIAFSDDPNATKFMLNKIVKQLKDKGAKDITQDQIDEISDLLDNVSKAAEGLPKDEAIIKLSHYLAGIAPVNGFEILQAMWYAKILSGITTQSRNFFANLFNSSFELVAASTVQSLKNKSLMPYMYAIKGLTGGFAKGAVKGFDILMTGVKKQEEGKYFNENALETFSWGRTKLGKAGKILDFPLFIGISPKSLRMVGRALSAADAVFSSANQEAMSNMLAWAQASKEGKTDPTVNNFKRANEILGNTKKVIGEAKTKASSEGYKPGTVTYKRRVIELVNQSRPKPITARSEDFGQRVTLNFDPEGFTKPIYDMVVGAQQKAPVLKMWIPFTRIVANLSEQMINYTPVGFYRAISGKRNPFTKDGGTLTNEERGELAIKAAMGLTAIGILSQVVGGDDDDWFDITANLSSDMKKSYEIQKGGERPYTITLKNGDKISYTDWPIRGLLAGIGAVRDAQKYSETETDFSDKLTIAGMGFMTSMYESSLMKGFAEFIDIFRPSRGRYEDIGDGLKKWAAQQTKSILISNFTQQILKLTDEYQGDPIKEAKGADAIYRDIPIINDGLNPIIDVFGDPVKPTTSEKLLPYFSISDDKKEKLIKFLNEKKIFIGVPAKKNIIDLKTEEEMPMTDKQYYDYKKLYGQKLKSYLYEYLSEYKNEDVETTKIYVNALKRAASAEAEEELFYR